jgi:hypothetical protein
LSGIISRIPSEEWETFMTLGYTIGGMMVWPANRVAGKMTINGARGFHPKIKDRFDLTVECIRRHFLGEPSPLADVLSRYASFFSLFRDFAGYVEFFLLQDLLSRDYSAVRFSMPFDDFATSPLPLTSEAYALYRRGAAEFLQARNERIRAWVVAR